jgi:hypothetical protein
LKFLQLFFSLLNLIYIYRPTFLTCLTSLFEFSWPVLALVGFGALVGLVGFSGLHCLHVPEKVLEHVEAVKLLV